MPGARGSVATLESYRLFKSETTAYGKGYRGPAQRCTFTFKSLPEQIDFVGGWLRQHYVSQVTSSIEQHGGRVLQVKLWRDASPTFHTDWRGEITADIGAEVASPGASLESPFPWLAAIVLAIFIVAVFNLEKIEDVIWGPGEGPFGIPWLVIVVGLVAVAMLWPRREAKREERTEA